MCSGGGRTSSGCWLLRVLVVVAAVSADGAAAAEAADAMHRQHADSVPRLRLFGRCRITLLLARTGPSSYVVLLAFLSVAAIVGLDLASSPLGPRRVCMHDGAARGHALAFIYLTTARRAHHVSFRFPDSRYQIPPPFLMAMLAQIRSALCHVPRYANCKGDDEVPPS